jgi:hypothetical protein
VETKRKEKTLICSTEYTQFDLPMELLIENCVDGIAEAVERKTGVRFPR